MKPTKPLPEVIARLNEYDILFVECPRCSCYIPNAMPGEKTCDVCGLKFMVRLAK